MMSDARQQWRECRSGEIQQMVNARRASRRRRSLVRVAAAASVVVVGMFAAFALPGFLSEEAPLTLNCRQVLPLAREYSAGTLDPKLREAVERHLDGCPGCREQFERQASGVGRASRRSRLPERVVAMQGPRSLPSPLAQDNMGRWVTVP
jgi:anti-sigma factor RsiW